MGRSIVGQCKLCGREEKLIKAHIIPDSLYRPMLAETGYGYLVSNVQNRSPGRLTTGIYDPELVCEPCERRFTKCDAYGASFLLKTTWDSLPTIDGPLPMAYVIADFDRDLLKMFFTTVLWRIAATARQEFASVNIGNRLKPLTNAILSDDFGDIDDWSILMARFTTTRTQGTYDPRHSWLDPRLVTFEGRECVKIYMAEFIIHIKISEGAWPNSIRPFCLQKESPLYVIMRDFTSSREFALIAKLARDSRQHTPLVK